MKGLSYLHLVAANRPYEYSLLIVCEIQCIFEELVVFEKHNLSVE